MKNYELKIRSLNNATTCFSYNEESIIVDPWIVGNLYENTWSPTALMQDLSFLKNVSKVVISHLHEDHWDIESIKHLNKDTEFHIPDLKLNFIISNKLIELGYLNIFKHKINKTVQISKNFKLKFIEPLNTFGQEIGKYIDGYETSATNIDCGILINHIDTQSNHLLLCDNTPYDHLRLKEVLKKEHINSLWYPYNGYAQDYPLCYDNLNLKEKRDISLKMSLKREEYIVKTIKEISPDYTFPHSSDFILNTRREEFFKVHSNEFMERKLYHKRLQKKLDELNIKSISQFLNISDEALFVDNKFLIERNKYELKKIINLPEKQNNKIDIEISNIEKLLEKSVSGMFERIKRFNIKTETSLNEWLLQINLENFSYYIDFSQKKTLKSLDTNNRKILSLEIDKLTLYKLLNRELHWDNAQIACILNWRRNPNIFNESLIRSINFLHN